MDRRRLLRGIVAAGAVGVVGCSRQEQERIIEGKGTLTIENRSGGEVRVAYALIPNDETLDQEALSTQQLTMDGDTFEVTYTEVTDGPYRFVVSLPDADVEPLEVEWDFKECIELGVTVQVLPDDFNTAKVRCVRPGEDRRSDG